jgi:phosphoribosylformylglycinamidine synthase
MAFAGHVGVALNVDMLVTEGDGISDSRMDSGEGKNWGKQVSGRREDLTLRALFNEELGAVLQVRTAERNDVMQTLREHGLSSAATSSARPALSSRRRRQGRAAGLARRQEGVRRHAADLHQVWDAVSWKIASSATTPPAPTAEHAAAASRRPRPACAPDVRPAENVAAPFINLAPSPAWPSCASRA